MALSRSTKDVVGGSFTLNTRIVFGHECDHPRYVSEVVPHSVLFVNLGLKFNSVRIRGFSAESTVNKWAETALEILMESRDVPSVPTAGCHTTKVHLT